MNLFLRYTKFDYYSSSTDRLVQSKVYQLTTRYKQYHKLTFFTITYHYCERGSQNFARRILNTLLLIEFNRYTLLSL